MNNKGFTYYSVGEEFDRKMESDGAIFEIDDNICQCIIGLTNISPAEIEAVDKGRIEISLSYIDGVIYICASIDDILLFDMPFNMGLYEKFQLEEPENNGYLMPIFLVDNSTNIIKAIRVVGFNKEFSRKLYDFSKEQFENKITDYKARCTKIEKEYPTEKILQERLVFNVFDGKAENK